MVRRRTSLKTSVCYLRMQNCKDNCQLTFWRLWVKRSRLVRLKNWTNRFFFQARLRSKDDQWSTDCVYIFLTSLQRPPVKTLRLFVLTIILMCSRNIPVYWSTGWLPLPWSKKATMQNAYHFTDYWNTVSTNQGHMLSLHVTVSCKAVTNYGPSFIVLDVTLTV